MTEELKFPLQLALEDIGITDFAVQANEEQFILQITGGALIRRYHVSPKHAKRILLLLQRWIGAFEDKFGELKTALPEATQEEKKIGFQVQDAPIGVSSVSGTTTENKAS
jgi:hypothetical protein